jgi:hypothetical protein
VTWRRGKSARGPVAVNGLSRLGVVISIVMLTALDMTALFTALIDAAKWPIAGGWKRHKRLLPMEASHGPHSILKVQLNF